MSFAGEVRLTTDPGVDTWPSWSPDRTKIAFASDRQSSGYDDIWIMNADGSNQMNITNLPGITDTTPCWSPDGQKIAFASNRTGKGQIYTMTPTGGNVIQITNRPNNCILPCWSSDMTKIVYCYQDAAEIYSDIYIHDIDSGTDTPLILTARTEFDPRWSKYNDIVAYTSDRPYATYYNIYTKPAFGGEEFFVTSQGPSTDYRPNWCNNDSQILFDYYNDPGRTIWIINSNGGIATQLTTYPPSRFYADISQDNIMVAYNKITGFNYDIWSCPFAELGQIDVVPTSLGNIKALYAGEQPAKASPPPAVEAEPPRGGLPAILYPQ